MKKFGERILLIFIFLFLIDIKITKSSDLNNYSSEKEITNYAKYNAPEYTLGPGDKISIKVFKTEDFNSIVSVLPDGTINLPRIGSLKVWGITIDKAQKKIQNKYSTILRNPIIYVDLIAARDIRVLISGEVQIPGLYSLSLNANNNILSNADGGEAIAISSRGWPTVVEAIQKSGGITSRGDIRNIEVRRANNPEKIIKLNYWNALKTGMPTYNPYIYDGDSIKILKAKNRTTSESITIAGSSFTPASITVNVIGEVKRPGPQKIKANSPLNIAIFAAGGLNEYSNKNSIKLVRLINDGSTFKKSFRYSPSSDINELINPALKDGDVVIVSKNLLANATSKLKFAVEPVGPIINAASLYRILNRD